MDTININYQYINTSRHHHIMDSPMENHRLELLTVLLDEFVKGQQEANVYLRDKIAILEQENRTRERREDLGEVETNTRTVDGLLARIVHLEGRVLDLERVSAIKEWKVRALGESFNSLGGTSENTNENMKLFENIIKNPSGKNPSKKDHRIDQCIKKDLAKYFIE